MVEEEDQKLRKTSKLEAREQGGDKTAMERKTGTERQDKRIMQNTEDREK